MDNRDIWINRVQGLKYKTSFEMSWISYTEFGDMDIIHEITTPNHVIISATSGQSNFVPTVNNNYSCE